MNIININSNICLGESEKAFIKEVLKQGDRLSLIRLKIMDDLIEKIPIYLLNENFFNKELKKMEIKEEGRIEFPPIELLGFYKRENRMFFENNPIIVLCLEKIADITYSKEEFLFLTTLTVAHEFAHALMDIRNENKDYPIKDEFFEWMEESFANAIALKIINNFVKNYTRCKILRDDKIFLYAKEFIKRQPANYALGGEIFKEKLEREAMRWKSFKEMLFQTKNKLKKEYLDYVKFNYLNIEKEKLKELFDSLFELKRN